MASVGNAYTATAHNCTHGDLVLRYDPAGSRTGGHVVIPARSAARIVGAYDGLQLYVASPDDEHVVMDMITLDSSISTEVHFTDRGAAHGPGVMPPAPPPAQHHAMFVRPPMQQQQQQQQPEEMALEAAMPMAASDAAMAQVGEEEKPIEVPGLGFVLFSRLPPPVQQQVRQRQREERLARGESVAGLDADGECAPQLPTYVAASQSPLDVAGLVRDVTGSGSGFESLVNNTAVPCVMLVVLLAAAAYTAFGYWSERSSSSPSRAARREARRVRPSSTPRPGPA